MKQMEGLIALAVKGFRALMVNCLALLGALALFATLTVYTHPDLLQRGEEWLYTHLYARKVASVELDVAPQASERVTAVNLLDLTQEQAAAAFWLSKKYRVAPEPMGALVAQAYELGEKRGLDPRLILSVVAIESRFNPFAQSAVGAQGLMQVMTRVHKEKYESFGGTLAAFDPVSNMQVGSLILKDCIDRFGGIERGLVCYVGAAKLPNDGGYSSKVLAEHGRLQKAIRDASNVLPAEFKAALAQRKRQQQAEQAITTARADGPAGSSETATAAKHAGAATGGGAAAHDIDGDLERMARLMGQAGKSELLAQAQPDTPSRDVVSATQ